MKSMEALGWQLDSRPAAGQKVEEGCQTEKEEMDRIHAA